MLSLGVRHLKRKRLRSLSTFTSLLLLIGISSVFTTQQENNFDNTGSLTNYYCLQPSDLRPSDAWICTFSLEPIVQCRQVSTGAVEIVSQRSDVLNLSGKGGRRFAFINISECTSVLPNRLRIDLLSEFENFIVAVSADGRHAHSCPDVHVLSATFKRISHPAKCLVLLNITQELLDNTDNLDRFDTLKEFVIVNSSFMSLTPSLYSFLHTSNVEKIVIRNTELTNFEMTYRNFNQSLSVIDLSSNKLSRFDIDANVSFPNAVSVKLANNKLFLSPQFLRFDHKVTIVDLSNCGLRSVLDFNGQMHSLNLSHNKIAEIANSTFDNVDALAVLDLSYNALTTLPDAPIGAHLSLYELDLSHNEISEIPDRVFGNSTLLVRLDLSYNKLVSISEQALSFARLPMLMYLNLDGNRLISIPPIEPFSDSIFVYLNSNLLRSLNVVPTKFNRQVTVIAQNNSISDYRRINTGMYEAVTSVDQLLWDSSFLPPWASSTIKRSISIDVSMNQIKSLDAHVFMANFVIKPFNHFGVVSFYNLTSNPLECSCELLNHVRYLLEAYNVSSEHKISLVVKQVSSMLDMKCRIPPANADLRGKKNGGSLIPLSELGNDYRKRQLRCSDDQVRCPDECFCFVDKKSGFKTADCAECDCLHEMPITIPPNTSVIHLEGNFIKVLGCKKYLRDARQLYLQNNLVDSIEECIYRYLQNVQYLRLDSNHIIRFPYKLAYLESLTRNESVNLANNSFSCECSDDVRDAFEHFGSRLVSPDDIECHTEDGVMYSYLHYLDLCSLPEELRSATARAPSGIQLVFLVVVCAIVAVLLIIITIVTYYFCCLKYLASIRRNLVKIMLRFSGSHYGERGSVARQNSVGNGSSNRSDCSQSCFNRVRNQFQFAPLQGEEDFIVENEEQAADEAEYSLTVDAGASVVSGPL